MSGLGIYIVLVIIIVFFVIYEYNFCTRLRNKCYQSKSSIDVFLTQRFDLIPNLVEVVKGYAKYEKETLAEVVELRKLYDKNKEFYYSTRLNNELNHMLAIAEDIPELKANEQFLMLQRQLIKMESQLQAARRNYNGDVTLYNTKIEQFPAVLIASSFGFSGLELYKAEEYKKTRVNIDIDME